MWELLPTAAHRSRLLRREHAAFRPGDRRYSRHAADCLSPPRAPASTKHGTKAASSPTCLAAPTLTPRFVAAKTQQLPLHGPLFASTIGGKGQGLAVWPEGWKTGLVSGAQGNTFFSF